MIGLLGGGNMGEAIIKGMILSGKFLNSEINVTDVSNERVSYLKNQYGVNTPDTLESFILNSDVIVLAVKPQVFPNLLKSVKPLVDKDRHLFISIAAGVKLEKIEEYLGNNLKIVRVMPNTPAFVLQSMSALAFNKNIKDSDKQISFKIFDAIGESVELDENYLDAVTALSGSGPGYISMILEAFSDAGVKIGLSRDIANKLIIQTFVGTLELIKRENLKFIDAKNIVTSPGGTTISGIHELEKGGFKGIIMNCVEAAYKKSIELSKG